MFPKIKILFSILAIVVLAFVLPISRVEAQGSPGYWECEWLDTGGGEGTCVVNLDAYSCDPADSGDYDAICGENTNINDCDAIFGNCELPIIPETCWEWQAGVGCTEIPLPPGYVTCTTPYFPTEAECVAAGGGWSCATNTYTCNIAFPGEYTNFGACDAECVNPGNKTLCEDEKSINTAIGCIPIDAEAGPTGFFLRWALGIGGGIAFLLIVYSGIMIMTASGNPEKLKAGQELLTAAITGLLLLIFSAFILRVIGKDILVLPGFGT